MHVVPKYPQGFTGCELFDCRNYIKPGDTIFFKSMWACDGADDSARRNPVDAYGTAVRIHREYIWVKLRKTTECVNRWDIIKVNRTEVREGCFKNLEDIEWRGNTN